MYNPPLGAFQACVRSVLEQTCDDWEWCLVDDCSTRREIDAALAELAGTDPRIRVHRRAVNGGIVAASNDAIAMATGEFIALLDHDDALVPTALADVTAMLSADPDDSIDYLYGNEMHVHADGTWFVPFEKPDWSPERFRASMYTCHLSVMRRSVVVDIGGFRDGFDGSQDHDLVLRATEAIGAAGRRVAHLPVMTYHWRHIASSVSRSRSTVGKAVENGRRAVQEQCDRLGIAARVEHGDLDGCYRLVRELPAQTRVTVVAATTGEVTAGPPHRLPVLDTLRHLTTGLDGVTFAVAHPVDLDPALDEIILEAAGQRWQPVPVVGTWTPAVALDQAVHACPGDVLVAVAPGLVPRHDLTPDWLETMAALALQPGVGICAALVATPDDRVLLAGWDEPEFRTFQLAGLPVGTGTAGNDLFIERECSQVSLAAAAIATPRWHEFKHHAATMLDWDAAGRALSKAMRAAGASAIWTPFARFDRVARLDEPRRALTTAAV